MIRRLLLAAAAAVTTAIMVAIVYAVVDLYMNGHGLAPASGTGRPWYYYLFTVLLFVAPLAAAVVAYRRS